MKKGLTYIIFVIDRSGSMSSICDDMIGGFNSFIKTQQKANLGECRVFAYKFDTEYDIMFENFDLNYTPTLDRGNYIPRGGTALYDSLGKTITDIGYKLSLLKEEDRPEKVLVVTITDGEDNSRLINVDAKHFDSVKVKEMVEHQTKNYNWSFAYIGANQDAWSVGSKMGYSVGSTLNYTADAKGTAYAFRALSDSTSNYRSATSNVKFSFTPPPTNDIKNKVVVSNSKKVSKKISKKSIST